MILQIAQSTLEVFNELIGRLGSDFSAYAATVLTHIIDRYKILLENDKYKII